MDVKETMDMLKAVEAMADAIKGVLEDGKINVLDIAKLMPVIAPAREAIAGMSMIKEELMDLDKDEVAALSAEMFVVLKKMMDAFAQK